MKRLKIAILGATSHIAKGLINNFILSNKFDLHLYARSPSKVRHFLDSLDEIDKENCIIYDGYQEFARQPYDVVINCIGVGTINKLQGDYSRYFMVTEEYDNLIIAYLRDYLSDALYISISSGAVYGGQFLIPAEENTVNNIQVNHIVPEDYYSIVRINAEAKHRAFKNLKIVDLRIFSYFSRFIDLADRYFITDIIDCILNKKTLITDGSNIIRDYIYPEDFFSIIMQCMNAGRINQAFDIISSKPVEKKEILDYFSSEYGLKYEIKPFLEKKGATGTKNIYYSNYHNIDYLGYRPKFTSMYTIIQEAKYILNKN